MRNLLSVLLLLGATKPCAFAQDASPFGQAPGPGSAGGTSPSVDVPLYDAPFNFERGGYTFPSMRQSVRLSTSYYENFHHWIGGTTGQDEWWRFWGVIGFDALSYWMPFGSNWMRAEWHRSVLTRNDISSYNDIYRFHFFSDTINVTEIRDADLARLKTDSNPDMVRMSSAGFESRVAQNLLFERHHFYDDVKTFDLFAMWMNALNSTVYLSICGSEGGNIAIQKMRVSEGASVGRRDFTGLDCTSWTYDLFRPDEPYVNRGTHPSGVGVNRYINHATLNDRERSFLRRQMFFSLLNFADPFLYGMEGFDGSFLDKGFRWNANLAHTLTSFGYVVDARLFLRSGTEKYLLTLHNGFDHNYYPGLSAEWIDHPVGDGFFWTNALTVWTQPAGQRLDTPRRDWLLNASSQLAFHWTPLTSTYFGVQAKTPGWMLGDPYLNGNVSVWTGFKTSFF